MVPDLLAVVGAGGQPQVDGRVVSRHRRVLALAVDAERLGPDAQQGRHPGRLTLVGVPGLDRLAEARIPRPLDVADRHRHLRCAFVPQRAHVALAPAHRGEQRAAIATQRQIRAAEHAEHHLSGLDQAERHRVLLAPEEALGAVDGVEGPVAAPHRVGRAQVDPGQDLLGVDPLAQLLAHPLHDRGEEIRLGILAQGRRVLLADHRIPGTPLRQPRAHDRLRGEIGDRDGAPVRLLELLRVDQAPLNVAADARRSADRLRRGGELGAAIEHPAPPIHGAGGCADRHALSSG